MLAILATSSLVGITASSWVLVWLCLEMNTLCMCWLLSKETKEMKKKDNSTMMYYLVQVSASILMLMTTLMKSSTLSETMSALLILLKMGVWPAHAWYMKLISYMDMKMSSFIVVMTWQKILPTLLVFLMSPSKTTTLLILGVSLFSLITPLTKISEKMNMKSIMALSSLNNNSWLILSFASSIYSFIVFLSLYSSALLSTLKTMKNMTKKSNTISLSFWLATMIMSNISGLPPFTMFWAKLMAVKAFMKSNMPSEVLLTVVASACLMLYHYLWMALSEMTKKSTKSMMKTKEQKNSKAIMMITASSAAGMLMFIS